MPVSITHSSLILLTSSADCLNKSDLSRKAQYSHIIRINQYQSMQPSLQPSLHSVCEADHRRLYTSRAKADTQGDGAPWDFGPNWLHLDCNKVPPITGGSAGCIKAASALRAPSLLEGEECILCSGGTIHA